MFYFISAIRIYVHVNIIFGNSPEKDKQSEDCGSKTSCFSFPE